MFRMKNCSLWIIQKWQSLYSKEAYKAIHVFLLLKVISSEENSVLVNIIIWLMSSFSLRSVCNTMNQVIKRSATVGLHLTAAYYILEMIQYRCTMASINHLLHIYTFYHTVRNWHFYFEWLGMCVFLDNILSSSLNVIFIICILETVLNDRSQCPELWEKISTLEIIKSFHHSHK